MIYFDYNSTAPYSPSVRSYLSQGILQDWQNPSAVYPKARILEQQIKKSRKCIAEFLNCSVKNLFFTSGGTESINTVLSADTLKLNQLSHFISSHLEHHATIERINYFSNYHNIKSYWLSNNKHGEINLDSLEEFCREYPNSLVSLLSSNNETGVIFDIKNISKIAKKHNCLVHIDAVQSLGKTPLDLTDWDVDFASFSGHKIGAMKGIGLLYARKPFSPLMYGGGQERNLRPGTYNFPAIYSLKLAMQDINLEKWEGVKTLRDYFEQSLLKGQAYIKEKELESPLLDSRLRASAGKEGYEGGHGNTYPFKINCQKASRLPNTSNLYCMGKSNQEVLLRLSQEGIYISLSSACNAGSPEPSHVIFALGISKHPRDYARSCIRVSLSPANKIEEVDFLIKALRKI